MRRASVSLPLRKTRLTLAVSLAALWMAGCYEAAVDPDSTVLVDNLRWEAKAGTTVTVRPPAE